MALGRPDTGSLNRELEQRQIQSEAKPSGELFNQTANSPYTAQYKQGLKFPLKQVQILDQKQSGSRQTSFTYFKNYVERIIAVRFK